AGVDVARADRVELVVAHHRGRLGHEIRSVLVDAELERELVVPPAEGVSVVLEAAGVAPAGADGSEGVPPRHEDGIGAPVRGAVAELAEAVLPPAPGLVALERAHVAASGLDRRERPAFRDPLRLGGLALVPDD